MVIHQTNLSLKTEECGGYGVGSCFFGGFLVYIILFPLVAPVGIYTFYFAAFLASTIIYTGAAIVGYDFADQIIKLDEQLSNFEVTKAQCFAEEDREEILNKISTMYDGGLDEFNLSVRDELRKDILRAVRHTPRMLLPYHTLLTGLIASFGFMFLGSPGSAIPIPRRSSASPSTCSRSPRA
ncbi:hypothetical protein TrLO_g3041 [Triparma laevis f. longispina]|uniref:Uncharacterized protein n=1 Tax=Triparma laevis f. longispina TaxID=1714387 RepID=A0A9W7ADF7_9STRA|nr:hypothetical protein TrLO_g3041 [Triparma laevis f. longispina]